MSRFSTQLNSTVRPSDGLRRRRPRPRRARSPRGSLLEWIQHFFFSRSAIHNLPRVCRLPPSPERPMASLRPVGEHRTVQTSSQKVAKSTRNVLLFLLSLSFGYLCGTQIRSLSSGRRDQVRSRSSGPRILTLTTTNGGCSWTSLSSLRARNDTDQLALPVCFQDRRTRTTRCG